MPSSAKTLESWNRRLHYYLGLYFLLFLWLFSLTGLMLNHQQWFRDLYERRQTSYDVPIEGLAGNSQVARTRDAMRQPTGMSDISLPVVSVTRTGRSSSTTARSRSGPAAVICGATTCCADSVTRWWSTPPPTAARATRLKGVEARSSPVREVDSSTAWPSLREGLLVYRPGGEPA